jgi:hypothetical protein
MGISARVVAVAVLLTFSAAAVTPVRTEVVLTVKDAGGHSIDDLKQDDFEFSVDGRPTPICRWMSARDMWRHTVYTLRFDAGAVPRRQRGTHTILIHVKRDGVQPEYSRTLTY